MAVKTISNLKKFEKFAQVLPSSNFLIFKTRIPVEYCQSVAFSRISRQCHNFAFRYQQKITIIVQRTA